MSQAHSTGPGARGSPSVVGRFLKGKRRDAMDEIKAWISDTKAEFGRGNSSRVSAQPPKNVTEQKMLESKLFEMSKQRYNFMLHSRWQQKLFMEKQRQKTAIMKDLLKNVDLERIKKENSFMMKKGRHFHFANIQQEHSPRIAMSEVGRSADDARTISPAVTAMTAPEGYQKKTVTFVTEKTNLRQSAPPVSSTNLSTHEPHNISDIELPPIKVTRRVQPEITESKVVKAYIIPLEGRWPVHDDRFVRLHQSLSENYMGRRKKDLPIRGMAFV